MILGAVSDTVAVDDGIIIAMGPQTEIEAEYTTRRTLAGNKRIVMPGLINGHGHAAMTLLRGVADDLALMDWLNNYIFPSEVEFVDSEFVRIGTELACWEMIRGGTTTFVDMYYFPDTVASVVVDCGMRAMISATVIDQRSPDAENAADSIRKGSDFIRRWKGRNSRITPIFGPHANYTLSAEQLQATRQAAIELGVPISIHMSESPFELQYSKDTFGKTSIEFYESIGFLDGPTIAAHVVWPTAAGSGPMYPLCEGLGIPAVSFGVGYSGSNEHSPNENIRIQDYVEGIKCMGEFIRRFAGED